MPGGRSCTIAYLAHPGVAFFPRVLSRPRSRSRTRTWTRPGKLSHSKIRTSSSEPGLTIQTVLGTRSSGTSDLARMGAEASCLQKATVPESAGVWPPPGVPSLMLFLTPVHASIRAPNNVKGGNLGQPPSGASVPAVREAAGVLSAWSQPFNVPSRDHDDGATLGRRRRTRRPVLRDAGKQAPDNATGGFRGQPR